MNKLPIYAIAVFDKIVNNGIHGTVKFTEDLEQKDVMIQINLSGLKKSSFHGFHIHEAGDLSDRCTSMCSHFNPFGKNHGCPDSKERHVGDLGNLVSNKHGVADYIIRDNIIKLKGTKSNIIGRGLVIHAEKDDCGQGLNKDSLITGNSGKRIACAVIGYSKENYKC